MNGFVDKSTERFINEEMLLKDELVDKSTNFIVRRKDETIHRQRRSRMEIINTILSLCVSGKKKTQVMYGANLSYQQLCAYLELLISVGLLTVKNVNNEKRYMTSGKGLSFLKYFREINALLQKPQLKVGVKSPPPIFYVEQE